MAPFNEFGWNTGLRAKTACGDLAQSQKTGRGIRQLQFRKSVKGVGIGFDDSLGQGFVREPLTLDFRKE